MAIPEPRATTPRLPPFRLLSFGSSRYIVEAFVEVARALAQTYEVEHHGLAADDWYSGHGAVVYEEAGIFASQLPRPSGRTTAWWSTPDADDELRIAAPSLRAFISSLIGTFRPDVVLFADDRGELDLLVLGAAESADIPLVLLEHGHSAVFDSRWTLRGWRRMASPLISRTASLRRRSRRGLVSAPGPSGTNGDYAICSYSPSAKERLLQHGVEKDRIFETGFPYFDILYRLRAHVTPPVAPTASFVSSGWGMFSAVERAVAFYTYVCSIAEQLRRLDVGVSLRLKPGERPESFLPKALMRTVAEIPRSDERVPSYTAVADSAVVLGDASTVLLEAALLRRAPVLLGYGGSDTWGGSQGLEHLLASALGIDNVAAGANIEQMWHDVSSSRYSAMIQKRLLERERDFFYRFDGRSASRCADVLIAVTRDG